MVPLSNESVLITGAEGFTGRHLSTFLESRGFKVFGTALKANSSDIINLDINQDSDVKALIHKIRPDYIVHLAAISFVRHPYPLDFYKVNVLGTESILRALLEINHSPRKILIPSSATVYGDQDESILKESMVPNPNNHYGNSKLAMERIVSNYFDRLPIIVARPFNYTGFGQSDNFIIPKLVNHFKLKKETIELGNLNSKREFNSVKFVTDVYLRLLKSDASSEIINVCSSKTYSIEEILIKLNHISGHEIKPKLNPAFVRENETMELKGSIEKLANIISIPDNYNIDSLLEEMLQS